MALVTVAEARAKSLKLVADALNSTDEKNAAALSIAEQYVKALNQLAKSTNTLILPSNVGDVSSIVSQVRNKRFVHFICNMLFSIV